MFTGEIMFRLSWVLFIYILCSRLIVSHSFSISSIISNVCKFTNVEICDAVWIRNDLAELQWKFDTKLYGQPLASEIIISALMGHFESASSSSPLVLSFHGSSGVGKTYVVQFIVNSLYKKGLESKFVHSYVGSTDFPAVKNITDYKEKIEKAILGSVKNCPQSLFIFDEVHKLQTGILDTISSLIRCSKLNKGDLDLSKAIFILISNTGSKVIVNKALQLNRNGISRDQFKLNDFENDIIAASSKEGGLVESGLITYSFIDHFVPFFPLEESHIIQCIKEELRTLRMESLFTENLARDVIEDFTFMPEPDYLYSSNGCKRVPQKLSVRVFSHKIIANTNSKHFESHTDL